MTEDGLSLCLIIKRTKVLLWKVHTPLCKKVGAANPVVEAIKYRAIKEESSADVMHSQRW